MKKIDGVTSEPVEELKIDLPEEVSGKAIEMVNQKKRCNAFYGAKRRERMHLNLKFLQEVSSD
ncbi:MAG: hypothetical protein R2784_00150 [Saprospiraceae bacterium]